jgi:hypothetical protein
MSFKVGDVCEVIGAGSKWGQLYIGTECVVTSEIQPHPAGDGHFVRLHDGLRAIFPPFRLRLKRPPANYDGNQAGDWELCPFQPYKKRETA